MTTGSRIRALRKQRGMTQTELAEAIGTSKQNICKYETGLVEGIPFDKFIQLAEVLQVSAGCLAGLEPQGEAASSKKGYKSMTSLEVLQLALEGARKRVSGAAFDMARSPYDDSCIKRLKDRLREYDEIAEMIEKAKEEETPCPTP